jgi:allantoin racemase
VKILVVNCNTTESMTEKIVAGAREHASPGTEILGLTPQWGVESAEGWYDSYISAAAVMHAIQQQDPTSYDAIVMAGFGEHGREGVREIVDVPVVDITEAAAHFACLLGRRYGVVTTLDRTTGLIEDSLTLAGVGAHCVGALGTGLPVLDLEEAKLTSAFTATARKLLACGADVLILGCAGMTGMAETLSEKLEVPVIDGVGAAVQLAESLVRLGISTSRRGYPHPLHKRRTWH